MKGLQSYFPVLKQMARWLGLVHGLEECATHGHARIEFHWLSFVVGEEGRKSNKCCGLGFFELNFAEMIKRLQKVGGPAGTMHRIIALL